MQITYWVILLAHVSASLVQVHNPLSEILRQMCFGNIVLS